MHSDLYYHINFNRNAVKTDNDTAKSKSNLKILAFFKLQSVTIKLQIFISDVDEMALASLLLQLHGVPVHRIFVSRD